MITAGYPRQMVHEYQLFYTQNISLSTKTLKTEKSINTFQHKGMLSFSFLFYIQMIFTKMYEQETRRSTLFFLWIFAVDRQMA